MALSAFKQKSAPSTEIEPGASGWNADFIS